MKKATIIIAVILAFSLFSFIVYAIGSPPKISVTITDTNQAFDVTVQGHKVKANYGTTDNPDVIIKMDSKTLVAVYSAEDFRQEAVNQYKKGNLQVEVRADYATLALKGYKAIFDSFEQAVKQGMSG